MKLEAISWGLWPKMKLAPCPRCGNPNAHVQMMNKVPTSFYVTCFSSACGLRTQYFTKMSPAIYCWNGVFLRRKNVNGEYVTLRKKRERK